MVGLIGLIGLMGRGLVEAKMDGQKKEPTTGFA